MIREITALDEATTLFDSHCLARFGYQFHEYVVITDSAPVLSVREGVRDYLGSDIKVSNESAREILEVLEGAELFEEGEYKFIDPNQFIVAVATTIEI